MTKCNYSITHSDGVFLFRDVFTEKCCRKFSFAFAVNDRQGCGGMVPHILNFDTR